MLFAGSSLSISDENGLRIGVSLAENDVIFASESQRASLEALESGRERGETSRLGPVE